MTGIFYDQNDNPFPQKGRLVVTHEPDFWVIEGDLTITTHETQKVVSRYEVQPLAPDSTCAEWKSETGGPEPVFGLFVLVEDTIMSPWHSKSGAYWGQEILTRISPGEYRGRGFAFLQNKKVSAWATRLTLG
jgi:hypothetical protein